MGALPDRLPGFQDITDDARRQRVEQLWGVTIPPRPGKHQTAMMHAMERGELRSLYVIGENPVQSDADQQHVQRLFEGLDFLVVQDITMTAHGATCRRRAARLRRLGRVHRHLYQQRAARPTGAEIVRSTRRRAR